MRYRTITVGGVILVLLAWGSPAFGQDAPERERDPIASRDTSDTYGDESARALIERARAARGSEAAGLQSYEATVYERIYLGLSAFRFRRERGLYRQQRAARIRWEADGTETIRWLGVRKAVPIIGDVAEIEIDEPEEMDEFPINPTGDRMMLAGWPFLHPLSDTAAYHYRFRSGDTMQVILQPTGRTINMGQIIMEPRRSEFGLLGGSLWFDLETAALVQAAFKPARDFNLEIDEPDEAEDVPGFLKPIVFSVEYMTVEYSLEELQWWLPRRVRFDGEGRAGKVLRMPLTMELEARDFDVNMANTVDPGEELPEGWTRDVSEREDEEGNVRTVVTVQPPDSALIASDYLDDEEFKNDAFTKREINELKGQLEDVLMPHTATEAERFEWGFGGGLVRYNRVEALSVGARIVAPRPDNAVVRGTIRLGIGDWVPNMSADYRKDDTRGFKQFEAYYELKAAADWGNPMGMGAVVNTLLLGYDDAMYYRAGGVATSLRRESGRVRYDFKLFGEYHWATPKETDFSIWTAISDDDMPDNIIADEISVAGLAVKVRGQVGVDPSGWQLFGTAWGEGGLGDMRYGRLAVQGGVTHPLLKRLAFAVEVGTGAAFGDVPVQKRFFLGGVNTLRAFPIGVVQGEAFWLGRVELSNRLPMFRLVAFADFGWAGPRSEYGFSDYSASIGAGLSLLDGLARIDVAGSLRGREPNAVRVYFYLDALL